MQPINSDEQRPSVDTFLLSCGVIGAIAFGLINFSLSAVNMDYIIGRQPIGDLELLPDGWIQSFDFILFGLFSWAFAIGLRKELNTGFGSTLIPLTQELVALGLILAGIFARDPMHKIGSIVMFTFMTTSCFIFAWRFKGDPRWKGWYAYSLFTGLLMIVFLSLFVHARANHGYAGLFERFAMITRGIWLFCFAVKTAGGARLAQEIAKRP